MFNYEDDIVRKALGDRWHLIILVFNYEDDIVRKASGDVRRRV